MSSGGERIIKKNTLYNTIKSLFSVLFPLITLPYVSRVLMAENLGKINFGLSIVGYASLIASLGISTYAIRECSRVKDDKDELNKVASQIFTINFFTTIFAYVVLLIILVFVKPLENYRVLIIIQSTTILFNTIGADWINSAMEDFKYITIRTVAAQLVSLVLMFIFVHRPEHYLIYAIICVVSASAANVFNFFYRRKYCRIKLVSKIDLKKHIAPILLLFSLLLSQTIFVNSDITILGLIKGDFETGLYSISVKFYTIVKTIVASVAFVVLPQLSYYFKEQNKEEVARILKYSMNFIIVLGFPCIVGLNGVASSLIYVVSGKEYLGAALSLHILTFALVFSFLGGWVGNMILIPSNKEKVFLLSNAIAAILNLILNLILIPHYGLNAAALTTVISEAVGFLIMAPFVKEFLFIKGFLKMILSPFLGCLIIATICIVCNLFIDSYYIIFAVTIPTSILFYFLFLLLMKNEIVMGYVTPLINRVKNRKK